MKYDALKKKAKNFAVFLAAGLLFLGTAVPARAEDYSAEREGSIRIQLKIWEPDWSRWSSAYIRWAPRL